MTAVSGDLISCEWRKVDLKLVVDGDIHLLRWRRGWFVDEVMFDDRRIATSTGVFGRESSYGLELKMENGANVKLLFVVDAAPDWNDMSGEMRPRGVRLETAEKKVVAFGSMRPDLDAPFSNLYERAMRAAGLA